MSGLHEHPLPTVVEPGRLTALRAVFEDAGYTEPSITARLHTAEMPPAQQRRRALPLFLWRTRAGRQLDTLIRLFVLHERVPYDHACAALTPTPFTDCEEMGLLRRTEELAEALVELHPWEGLLLAADWANGGLRESVMGVAASTRALGRFMIRRPVDQTLDLGTGCGALSFLAARSSGGVYGVDLNPRAVAFARFNAELNGVANVRFEAGDWFAPVEGRTFDYIVCNPPFVIGPGDGPLHTHGGNRGDEVCRELVRSAPQYLRSGGYCQIVCNWACVAGEDWRDRLRAWVAATGCDAWVLHSHTEDAAEYVFQRLQEAGASTADMANRFTGWLQSFQQACIDAIGFGVITLRLSPRSSPWFRCTALREAPLLDGATVERRFALRDFLETHTDERQLLDVRLRIARGVVWETQHQPSAAGWTPLRSVLRSAGGLAAGTADRDVVAFLARCQDDRRLGELLAESARDAGQTPASFTAGFLRTVRQLLELGILEPASWPALSTPSVRPAPKEAGHEHSAK